MNVRVRRVLAPNPGPFTLEGTNTWIVGGGPSIVIDPGPDDPAHVVAVADEARPVEAILLTHHHLDHAPGAGRLAEITKAPVYSLRPEEGERALTDGVTVSAGGVRLRAVHTPGHTPDHAAFLVEDERLMFTGDAVLGRGTSVVDPPEGDMAAYVRSLRQMRRLAPRLIYPGHGPLVFDAVAKLDEYLEHREERERQVLGALAEGRSRAEEMVPGIYGDEVPADMYPVAARSLLAHLLKLEREGKAARTGNFAEQRFVPVVERACERCGRPAAAGSRFCRSCGVSALQEGPPAG